MRPLWHYEHINKYGERTRFIDDWQLKYRLNFHKKPFYSRQQAIETLMKIEENLEYRQYGRVEKKDGYE